MKPQMQTSLDFSQLFRLASILVSIGIIMVTGGGSWDISNHILNKPETFFAPPHALLYSGVGVSLVGFAILFLSWKKQPNPQRYGRGIKIIAIGITSLLSAGPIDFAWHSRFGLDGLLSPPHLILIFGMFLSSIGALYVSKSLVAESQNKARIIVSLIPVWLSTTGLLHSFSLPFSKTDYFDFNPDPVFGAVFASVSYPFLISTVLLGGSLFAKRQFGIATSIGAAYLGIMTLSAIIPNHTLILTIPFYLVNIIPIVLGDFIISKSQNSKAPWIAGAIFGSTFYFLYYPLITYTYNEVTLDKLMWPSMTSNIYFEMMPLVGPILILVGAGIGCLAAKFAIKISA